MTYQTIINCIQSFAILTAAIGVIFIALRQSSDNKEICRMLWRLNSLEERMSSLEMASRTTESKSQGDQRL